jgi:signal transduction histidine kinase
MRNITYYNSTERAVSEENRKVKLLHQVNILYDLLPTTQWIHLAAILVVFGLLFRHIDISLLSSWLGFVLMILLIRMFITNYYKKSVKTLDNAEYWFNWFLVGTTLYGIMWSATAILLIPAYDPKIVGLTALILSGLAAGGVAVSSVSIKVFIVYAVSTMLPYAAFLVSSGQNPQSSIGLLIFAFCFLISIVAYHVNSFFTNLIDLQLKTHMLEKEIRQENEKRRFAEKALLDNTLEEGLADLIRQQSRVMKDSHGLEHTGHVDELLSKSPEELSANEMKLVRYVELLNENLLSNIKSAAVFLKTLENSNMNETQRKNTQIVEKILHDAESAIERSFSEFQDGNTSVAKIIANGKIEKINIRRLLIYITHEIPLLYKAKYITIRRKTDKRIPQDIYGNKAALEEVLQQLLNNAFKYSDGGTINISVDLVDEEDDYLTLLIRIADSGVGMAKETVGYLNAGDVPDQPRSGLDIIKYLVSKLDGTLAAESTPGVGSRIEIKLTFSKVEESSLLPDTTSI